MKNPICISTGCLYRLFNDRNKIIEELRKFSPLGIELLFVRPEDLLNFDTNDRNLRYLRSLRFNSIHAPWKKILYGPNRTSKEGLKAISKLYKQINARNVVFHKDQVEDYDLISSSGFVSSIENDDWEQPEHSPEDIKKILDKNGRLKFTFDFAHALTVSLSDIPKYIDDFKDRLIEVHVSMLNKKLEDHWFLHKYDSRKIRKLLQYLKAVEAPLVLECVVSNLEEIKLIKDEMEYLRKI